MTHSHRANSASSHGFSDRTATEISRLFDAGHSIIPLGAGDDGKSPLVTFGGKRRLPLRVVLDRMRTENSGMYGIRLPGLIVVDVDTDTAPANELVKRRFGNSTVQVETARGRHHWFRLGNHARPANIATSSVRIDFKAGPGSYVAGPHAIRRDGVIYMPSAGVLQSRFDLPVFQDIEPDPVAEQQRGRRIPVGQRNKSLWQRACAYAPFVDTVEDLIADLIGIRNIECDEPETLKDSEVIKIAEWAWKRRLANSLWSGRNSSVRIARTAIDTLQNVQHGAEAFLLHSVLVSAHGHIPGKLFSIVPAAMIRDGLCTSLSRDRIYRAKDILIKHGFLVCRRRRVKQPSLYQLTSHSSWGQGGGVYNYIVTGFPGTGNLAQNGTAQAGAA